MEWYEEFIGKPWEGVPNPPESFTCGELLRYIYREKFGIDIVPIPVADASSLRDAVQAMQPDYFGLEELPEGERTLDYDAVFMARRNLLDHCGMVVNTSDGVMILHCANPDGTILSSITELEAQQGYTSFKFYRHPGVTNYYAKECICRR